MRNVFIPYFTDIFKDLAQQTELCSTKNEEKKSEKEEVTPNEDDKKSSEDIEDHGINKMIFLQYVHPLPLLLGQRLFQLALNDTKAHMDGKDDPTPNSCPSKNYRNLNQKKKIEKIDLLAFRKLFQKLFYSRMCTKLQLVFQLIDFDGDGFVTQVIANSQIEKYLTDMNKYMRGKNKYDFQDFVRMNSDFSSDIFMGVIILLHSQIPCANSFYRYFQNFRMINKINKTGNGALPEQRRQSVAKGDINVEDAEENEQTCYTTPKSFENFSNYMQSQQEENSAKNMNNLLQGEQLQMDKMNFNENVDQTAKSANIVNNGQPAYNLNHEPNTTQNAKEVTLDNLDQNVGQRNSYLLPNIKSNGRNSVLDVQNQILESQGNGGFSNCARIANQQLVQFPQPQMQNSNGLL